MNLVAIWSALFLITDNFSCRIVVPRLFEEKWRDTVFGFPRCVVRGAWCVARGAWRVVRGSEFLVGTLSP